MHTTSRYVYDEPQTSGFASDVNPLIFLKISNDAKPLRVSYLNVEQYVRSYEVVGGKEREKAIRKNRKIQVDLKTSIHQSKVDEEKLTRNNIFLVAYAISWSFLALSVISTFFFFQGIAVGNASWILAGFFSAVVSLISGVTGIIALNRSPRNQNPRLNSDILNLV